MEATPSAQGWLSLVPGDERSRVVGVYYLSDKSFEQISRPCLGDARLTVGAVIEEGVKDERWLDQFSVHLPSDVKGLIEVRAEEIERRGSRAHLHGGIGDVEPLERIGCTMV